MVASVLSSVCRGMRTAGRATIGSKSGIGDNFHWSGRNLGRGNRGANRDRAHQQRREGGDQMALKFRTRHCSISLFGSSGRWPLVLLISFTSVVPIGDFRQKSADVIVHRGASWRDFPPSVGRIGQSRQRSPPIEQAGDKRQNPPSLSGHLPFCDSAGCRCWLPRQIPARCGRSARRVAGWTS